MLRIAFCDDETEILEELESLTEQYCADRGCRMEYQAFHSPLELLAAMEKGTYFDAVFLDVLMPGENGISTARELRQTDQNIKIVFLTTSSEYAVDSYSVGAYFYQMKPLKKEIYSGLLDSLRAVCEKEQKKSLVVRTRNGITQISSIAKCAAAIFYIIWVMERCWRGTGGWNGWKNSLRNMETLFGFIVRFW